MGSTSGYKAYERRRAVFAAIVFAIAIAFIFIVTQRTAAGGYLSPAQIESNLTTIWIALLVLFIGAAITFWRLGNRESDFLVTSPPAEPEPSPMLHWRYVRRRERPALFRTVAIVLGLCAAGLVYFATQMQAVLKH